MAPAEGFLQGLLQGIAGGTAQGLYQQHEQQQKEDMANKRLDIDILLNYMNRPDFRPEQMGPIMQRIQTIMGAKAGSKKGRQQMSGAMGEVSSMNAPREPGVQAAPGPGMMKLTPFPRGTGLFKSQAEMGREELEAQKPMLEEKAKLEAQKQQEMMERQKAVQKAAEEQRRITREEADQRREAAAATKNIRQMAEAYKHDNPDLTDEQAMQMGSKAIIQAQKDKHESYTQRARNIESQIKTRQDNSARANRLADSLIQHRRFADQALPLKEAISTANRDVTSSESRIRELIAKRQGLLDAVSAAKDQKTIDSINGELTKLDGDLDAAYQAHTNAVDSVQRSVDAIDRLNSGQSGLTPPPSAPKTMSQDRYKSLVQAFGQETVDASLKARGVTVK